MLLQIIVTHKKECKTISHPVSKVIPSSKSPINHLYSTYKRNLHLLHEGNAVKHKALHQ